MHEDAATLRHARGEARQRADDSPLEAASIEVLVVDGNRPTTDQFMARLSAYEEPSTCTTTDFASAVDRLSSGTFDMVVLVDDAGDAETLAAHLDDRIGEGRGVSYDGNLVADVQDLFDLEQLSPEATGWMQAREVHL